MFYIIITCETKNYALHFEDNFRKKELHQTVILKNKTKNYYFCDFNDILLSVSLKKKENQKTTEKDQTVVIPQKYFPFPCPHSYYRIIFWVQCTVIALALIHCE